MLSTNIKRMLEDLAAYRENNIYESGGPSISMNKLTGKAGVLYEKLRYMVDYKDQHTIRRSAIERILKRNLLVKGAPKAGISLLEELLGSGYLPHKEVPEGIALELQKIVDKYFILGRGLDENKVASLMASEIQKLLYPDFLNDLIIECFYNTVVALIKYGGSAEESELNIETYIGCRRILFEEDQDTIRYAILVRHFPELPTLEDKGRMENLAADFSKILEAVEQEIANPLGWKIATKLKNHSIYFSVIREIVKNHGINATSVLEDFIKLEKEAITFLHEQYEEHFNFVSKSGTRAVAYILLTKVALAMALELPYEEIFLHSIDYFALGVNVAFHPALLFHMVKTIKYPSPDNTKAILTGVRDVVESRPTKPIFIKAPSTNITLQATLVVLYTIFFFISFGFILYILTLLHFSIVSKGLFVFFLTLVSYFGYRIRSNGKKWMVSNENEGAIALIWDFFTVPIVSTGKWLSRRFSSVNIFVFILDFIIETPFKFLLHTLDSFISFLREKKEDPS